ncbi:glycosyltransferase family 4 protein [Spirosoma sp. KNUC1025]|uniref:glycosyltransferase family 4 protein n=1 Tax=Spirosoma sp. KNUC1025 TaxID=2894082 RepID=UPI0038687C77|nr:glycosyltransferase family 4 protein [Spirosoma sp. KNUC1025]
MEIIHLILGKANPARMNGVNKVVHDLATQQQQAGFAVEVWGFSANPVHDYPERTYTTRLFGASRNPFGISASWKQAIMSRKNTIVVQLHGGFVPRFYAAARFLQQHQIPYLITPHGNYNWHALQRSRLRKKLYFNLFERNLLNGAGAIHALGQSEIDGLQSIFPNEKSVLIPYGFSALANVTAGAPAEFIVGFCGRLDIDHKGLDRLIEGFALFREKAPFAQLWIIGDGPHRQQLEKMVEQLALRQYVVFWGSQFGDEKVRLLSQCSVFVHASRYEGLPVAVLEAASLGIPCLVSEATNVGEAVRSFDAGYVIGQGTSPQVAEGLSNLYQQWQTDRLMSLRRNARRMVDEEFNWPRQLDLFNQLYRMIRGKSTLV